LRERDRASRELDAEREADDDEGVDADADADAEAGDGMCLSSCCVPYATLTQETLLVVVAVVGGFELEGTAIEYCGCCC